MHRSLAAGLVLATLTVLSANAAADVPNPPAECVGKSEGDACSFQNGDTGTCQTAPEGLTCVVGSGGGGDDGGGESDSGCSLAPTGQGSSGGWLLLGLAGLGAACRRRRGS